MRWLQDISATLSPGQPLYVMFYAAAIIFFCFFYTALVFNSKDTAENLKKSGAFIPGIRPPEFLILFWNVPFYFGGTSLLIIVVVVMDFMSQVQAHLMSHQYDGLMKKSNFKGYGGAGVVR
jgi:preprotein translocase subunit SecY